MVYEDRGKDLAINRRMSKVMDAIYKMIGWNTWRPNIKDWDKHGLDILLKRPGDDRNLWVDEKSATKYWNRDLQTFACELTTDNNGRGYGWFAKENNDYLVTTHLLFVWVRALEEELTHISSLRFLLVDKHDLQTYFKLETGLASEQETKSFVNSLNWNKYNKCRLNEHITFAKSNISPGFPVNALIDRKILEKMAIDGGEFTRFDVRDALRAFGTDKHTTA